MENKWLMFKNYMHNELGITKEDIRQWIQDAVKEQAEKLVMNEFNNFDVEKIVKKMVYKDDIFGSNILNRQVCDEVSKQIINRIEFKNNDNV